VTARVDRHDRCEAAEAGDLAVVRAVVDHADQEGKSIAVIVPWLNICSTAPLMPWGVNAAIPEHHYPMWLMLE